MNFTSAIFLFYFLPITVILFHLINRQSVKGALALLTIASLVFYAWEVPYYILIILSSVLVDWVVTNIMIRSKSQSARQTFLVISLISNLGLLAFFKYGGFLAGNMQQLAHFFHIDLLSESSLKFFMSITLPVGISFYTFQTLSYTIDIYDGKIHHARNFTEFICYITSFPQLVAGPIVRYAELEEDLKAPKVSLKDIEEGICIFILGLTKKVLIADSLAPLAEHIFDGTQVNSGFIIFLGVLAYALQLYFDFSGYSEMAIGLGRFFGLHFPQNFNSPYKASSISDFWRRWHMTLSFWFRDYVYIKLGGSRCSKSRHVFNLMLAMSLCGLWHGAGWNFIFWGFGHGVSLIIDKYFLQKQISFVNIYRRIWGILTVFILWIPFRAQGMMHAIDLIRKIFMNFLSTEMIQELKVLTMEAKLAAVLLLPVLFITVWGKNIFEFQWQLTPRKSIALTALFIVSVYVLLSRDYIPFLYFQF